MQKFDDRWFVAEGKQAGLPVIIRARQHLQPLVSAPSHAKLLRIGWPFVPDAASGLPSREQNSRMQAFEDAIFAELERDQLCIFFCVYLHDGVKRWFAYTSDVQTTCERINAALAGHERYPIEMQVEDDPTWQEYADMLAGIVDLPGMKRTG
jgi:hypothetical protein